MTLTDDATPSSAEATEYSDARSPAWMVAATGAVGLVGAVALVIEKFALLDAKLAGEDTTLSCDVNAFVSCGGVMQSEQAAVFGFPNPVIGVVGFSVVLTLGVVLLAGARLPGWVWAGLQAGTIFGIGFVTWLQFQSIYRLEQLCPYCMVVWAAMIPLFVVVTAHSLRRWAPRARPTRLLSDWTVLVVALWYLAVVAAIWFHFGDRLWA